MNQAKILTQLRPVLMIGGSGTVGTQATRTLRQIQPQLPITIAARNQAKAQALADEIGNATAISIDLNQPNLGIDEASQFSAVVAFVKDDTLNSLAFAQAQKIPYMSLSDFAFEVGPAMGHYISKPNTSPILLLGHHLGGIVTLTALHFVKQDFKNIHTIEIGATFDEEDFGGPAAQADVERVAAASPRPLLFQEGSWIWADSSKSTREFKDVYGNVQQGEAYSLLDTLSLTVQTGARSVRIDGAVRNPKTRTKANPAHDVVIEITGTTKQGLPATHRYGIITDDVHQVISGCGAALAIERLLGASDEPVAPGLYFPDSIENPDYVVKRIQDFGAIVRKLS